MSIDLAVILITHNSERWLPGFAQSWNEAQKNAVAQNTPEIVLVDSGSTDATLAAAPQHFPSAKILVLPNHGFSTAANRAAQETTAPWLLLCNADLTFAADFMMRLEQLSLANAACIAPRLLNPDGTHQPSVGDFPSITGILRDQFRPRPLRKYKSRQPTAPAEIDWAMGACLLINRSTFLEVGGFDEKYFLYVEEVDLQRRLHDAGHRVRFEPALAVTHHQPNANRPPRAEVQAYAARGMLRYFAKFGGFFTLAAYRLLSLLSGRLPMKEAFASRKQIIDRRTGP